MHFQHREISEVAFDILQISANLMQDLKCQTEQFTKVNINAES